MTEASRGRESGKSVLAARHFDDDDDISYDISYDM